MSKPSLADGARITLAAIRIFNGTAGLFAPGRLARRLGAEEAARPMSYPFRMFGIRTILIGLDLLSPDPAVRRHALRLAVVVHGSDTVSAFTTFVTRGLPRRAGATATAISGANLVLALIASRRQT